MRQCVPIESTRASPTRLWQEVADLLVALLEVEAGGERSGYFYAARLAWENATRTPQT